MATEKQKPKEKRLRKWAKRLLLGLVVLVVVSGGLVWAFLPRIVEKVMSDLLVDAELDHAEFKVREIGWNSAVIENVSMSDGVWQLKSKEVHIDYAAFDLIKGRLDKITMTDGSCVVDFSASDVEKVEVSDQGDPSEKVEEISESEMLSKIPLMLEQIGGVQAKGMRMTLKRDGRATNHTGDLMIQADGEKESSASFLTEDFQMKLELASEQKEIMLIANVDQISPNRFLNMLGVVIDYDGEILPEGIEIGSANLVAEVLTEDGAFKPMKVTGDLFDVSYVGDTPVQMESSSVTMVLQQDFSGVGNVQLSGAVEGFSLDNSEGIALHVQKNAASRWKTQIEWGGEVALVSAEIEKLDLQGDYGDKPLQLDGFHAKCSLSGGVFKLDGGFLNGGTKVPLTYSHELSEGDDWLLSGLLEVGPLKHEQPLPLLNAFTDLFDGIEITGETTSKFEFSLGASNPLKGVLSSKAKDLSMTLADGKVKAEGVSGGFQLHILPEEDPGQEDPSYYTLNFVSQKLHIGTKDALDFDLDHSGETPIVISGKGKLGDIASLEGEVKNLTLHGAHEGKEIDLVDTQFTYSLRGDALSVTGGFSLNENKIPFSYRHTKKYIEDTWELNGVFEITSVELNETVDNAGILIDAMEGISFTGKVAMRMGFSIGAEKDFDGALVAAMAGGTLTFEDEGPVIEGVKGNIRLSSLKTKHTDGFHRVTATTIKAFDMVMQNARLDFQMLPNGDISLKNISMKALGGSVWLDPFILPSGDADYAFKVRMKNLSLEQLAALFPDFDGRIMGNIDGLLPMQNKDGEFIPQRGGMYLTPGRRAKLIYDAGDKFSGGLQPDSREYEQMKMVEDSLKALELRVLSIRLFDPRDKDKAVVVKLRGQAPTVPGSPPIILNINGFKPDDDTVDFFDLLLKHRDKLNFGL